MSKKKNKNINKKMGWDAKVLREHFDSGVILSFNELSFLADSDFVSLKVLEAHKNMLDDFMANANIVLEKIL